MLSAPQLQGPHLLKTISCPPCYHALPPPSHNLSILPPRSNAPGLMGNDVSSVSSPHDSWPDLIEDWEVVPRCPKKAGDPEAITECITPAEVYQAPSPPPLPLTPEVMSADQAERMQGGFFDGASPPWRRGRGEQEVSLEESKNGKGSGGNSDSRISNRSDSNNSRENEGDSGKAAPKTQAMSPHGHRRRAPLTNLQPSAPKRLPQISISPATHQQARLVTVGARVQSHKHFHQWLDSPCDMVGKARSPGKHYTSVGRRLASHDGKIEGLWSEGNRFIVDKDL